MKKTALYDNPSGYGHGGLGYHHSLDELPAADRPAGTAPAWLPWVGLIGAGALGYAGLKGLGRVLRRAPRAGAAAAKPVQWSAEMEMLGKVDPKWQRMTEEATHNMAQQEARLAREQMFKAEQARSAQEAGATWHSPTLGKYGSVITALGRIARGS